MKQRKKILVILGTVVGVLLVALAALPMFFSDRIANRVKVEANGAMEARVDWRAAGLTLFGNFPNLTLRLDGLSVAGTRVFANDTLAKVGRLQVVLDLGSVLRNLRGSGPIVVRSVDLDRPVVSLRVLEDGTANWDIAKKTSRANPQTASRPLSISLRRLDIRDASSLSRLALHRSIAAL